MKRSSQINTDLRSAALNLLSTLPPAFLIPYIHPRLYAIHEMPDDAGLPGPDGIAMPPMMNLTCALFKSHGLYFIDDGQVQFLWVGRDAVPELIQDVFGLTSIDLVKPGKVQARPRAAADMLRLPCYCLIILFLHVLMRFWQNPETCFQGVCITLTYML